MAVQRFEDFVNSSSAESRGCIDFNFVAYVLASRFRRRARTCESENVEVDCRTTSAAMLALCLISQGLPSRGLRDAFGEGGICVIRGMIASVFFV